MLDGMGSEKERLVSVDELKNRMPHRRRALDSQTPGRSAAHTPEPSSWTGFFILGLQTGFALQMFVMAVVMMATTYRMVGATEVCMPQPPG